MAGAGWQADAGSRHLPGHRALPPQLQLLFQRREGRGLEPGRGHSQVGRTRFPWQSGVGADVTLADGIVVSRSGGLYFVVADKRVGESYHDKGDITVTWNKLAVDGDDDPDASPYRLAPVFTRPYPKSALTVEAVLAREAKLNPAR
jgi:hypothetical protein